MEVAWPDPGAAQRGGWGRGGLWGGTGHGGGLWKGWKPQAWPWLFLWLRWSHWRVLRQWVIHFLCFNRVSPDVSCVTKISSKIQGKGDIGRENKLHLFLSEAFEWDNRNKHCCWVPAMGRYWTRGFFTHLTAFYPCNWLQGEIVGVSFYWWKNWDLERWLAQWVKFTG